MASVASTAWTEVSERARQSCGISSAAIYRMVACVLAERSIKGTLVDVGCGDGSLLPFVRDMFSDYIGVDAVRYDGFSTAETFKQTNLDGNHVPLSDGVADVVAAIETIEHLENPRAFMRELVRIARPGGLIVVTTPNQLSLLSKICLLLKNQFVHFQERPGLYPAHLSALLEVDLTRLARENGLTDVEIVYTGDGRIPLVSLHWPRRLASRHGIRGRAFSDNVMLVASKATA